MAEKNSNGLHSSCICSLIIHRQPSGSSRERSKMSGYGIKSPFINRIVMELGDRLQSLTDRLPPNFPLSIH